MTDINEIMKYLALGTAVSGLVFSIIFLIMAIASSATLESSALASMITFLVYMSLILS
ncbi:MAG: hypothetical protein ACTSO9_20025 [Candidatus Helarchaeota archaeon]